MYYMRLCNAEYSQNPRVPTHIFLGCPLGKKFWWFILRGYMKPQKLWQPLIFKAQCMPRFVINCLKITKQTHPKIWAGLP